MPRLLHLSADRIEQARTGMRAPPAGDPSWKVSRPHAPPGSDPWFELSTQVPSFDTDVEGSEGPTVVATFETFGGVTGPARSGGATVVTLGGNPVVPGTEAPPHSAAFSRFCTARIAMRAEGLSRQNQVLLLASLQGVASPIVQTFLGTELLREDAIADAARLAIVADTPAHGRLELDLYLRLAALDPAARLGVYTVQGHLL